MRSLAELQDLFRSRGVISASQSEIRKFRFFDSQIVPAAGTTQLTFFQNPIGQGITSSLGNAVGAAKTKYDTNMTSPGSLPNGQAFLIESIEFVFEPGASAAANTFLPAPPNTFAAAAAAAQLAQLQDVNIMRLGGLLEFQIVQKLYLQDGPLGMFPGKCSFNIDIGLASNSATTSEVSGVNGRASGRPYYFEPEISLPPLVNFSVNAVWPGAVPLPSGFNGRASVYLDGYLSQVLQ
jgi:hypothetical protein